MAWWRSSHRLGRRLLVAAVGVSAGAAAAGVREVAFCENVETRSLRLSNWSATHVADGVTAHYPRTEEEVLLLLVDASKSGGARRLRAVGAGLSPNGVGFPYPEESAERHALLKKQDEEAGRRRPRVGITCESVMLTHLDRVLHVDKEEGLVTVEAGCTVRQVQEHLAEQGLTLANFSSILDQEMAGWTQVSAHGTGAELPPVEEQIVSMRVATPRGEMLTLDSRDGPLFSLAKVNLGTLGIVTQLTLRCAARHNLFETTEVESFAAIKAKHNERLREHKHVKYMFVPWQDEGVVVTCDKTQLDPTRPCEARNERALEGFKALNGGAIEGATFSAYRGRILERLGSTTVAAVQAVNKCELEFWRAMRGSKVADSSDILGFDCGGQQCVYESCFPIGTLDAPSGRDMEYVAELREAVEAEGIAAPCPIEVRYSAASSAMMSPAFSENPDTLFCWLGFVMYFPADATPAQRAEVDAAFQRYRSVAERLDTKYGAVPHWAKIEMSSQQALQDAAERHKPALAWLKRMRKSTDPRNVLAHPLIEKLNDINGWNPPKIVQPTPGAGTV
eukprot:Rhum_TRINITY_DN9423_c1_g1::Rhum_TRINITY_DN9423_c1_g1_i1::g.33467::m.33467/K00225/GLDH; L-galactono-1,4-lactone dehydrogenase